jgi:hypothetical protein
MSHALDSAPTIQKLVREWDEEDIDTALSELGKIIDDPQSTEAEILMARFASIGCMYVQARRLELNL